MAQDYGLRLCYRTIIENRKFIPADPSQACRVREGKAHSFCCRHQHLVSAGMPVAVIDSFEFIQIQKEQRQPTGFSRVLQAEKYLLRSTLQCRLVEQPCQRIHMHQFMQFGIDLGNLFLLL